MKAISGRELEAELLRLLERLKEEHLLSVERDSLEGSVLTTRKFLKMLERRK